MKSLLALLNSTRRMSPELEAYLGEIMEFADVRKDTTILKEGQVCRHIWFLESGLVRIYYWLKGKDITTWLLKGGDIFIGVEAFFMQIPSRLEIVTLEDCRMQGITYDKLQKACELYPEFLWHRSLIMENYYARSEQKHADALILSNEERYLQLLEKAPDLLQRVPVKYLYSYLGMSKATFERIRDKYARGKTH